MYMSYGVALSSAGTGWPYSAGLPLAILECPRPRQPPAPVPIYEYRCLSCGTEFEALVRKSKAPACRACGKSALERRFSLPTVKSESTHAQAMKAAKKRDRTQAVDRVEAQRAYERSHDD